MSTIEKVKEILKDANQGEYVSLKCENDSTNINGYVVYLSKEKVDAIKLDDWTKGWPKEEPTDLGPLCFEAVGSDMTVAYGNDYDYPAGMQEAGINFQYSTDNVNWTDWVLGETQFDPISIPAGTKLYLRGDNPNGVYSPNGPADEHFTFNGSGTIKVSGNIQYLIDPTGQRTDVPNHCYFSMFKGCTSLTSAPELPATTLADRCYQSMFYDCTSLEAAPELPATTLDDRCYSQIFFGCTSLETAPELPSETLANWCYESMFSGCTSLTSAPELPATTLADRCYYKMFSGCTEFSECHMKAEMQGVYNPSTHGDTTKTVVYDL